MVLSRSPALRSAANALFARSAARPIRNSNVWAQCQRTVQFAQRRGYASNHVEGKKTSDLPWLIGAVVVTVPGVYYLLQPGEQAHHDAAHSGHDEHQKAAPKGEVEAKEEPKEEKKEEPKEEKKEEPKEEEKKEEAPKEEAPKEEKKEEKKEEAPKEEKKEEKSEEKKEEKSEEKKEEKKEDKPAESEKSEEKPAGKGEKKE